MSILKLIRQPSTSQGGVVLSYHYTAVFDEMPKITYEKMGRDYVGTAVDEDGDVIASHLLEWKSYGDAFAGRETTIELKRWYRGKDKRPLVWYG